MGPALETFLQALAIALVILAAAGYCARPLLRRAFRTLKLWYERDMRLEEEQKREKANRLQAEQELKVYCHEEVEPPVVELNAERKSE